MNIRPLHDRIVVKRIEEDAQMVGGLYIPDSAKEKPQQGEVVAAGNGKKGDDGKSIPLDVKPGDRILFGKYSGSDIKIDGALRKVILHADRNGFFYVIDRANGKLLSAKPFVDGVNWATGVDLKTGMPVINEAAHPIVEKKVTNICPPDIGVKNWNPSAFSPRMTRSATSMANACTSGVTKALGANAPMPPVFGPLSSSNARL